MVEVLFDTGNLHRVRCGLVCVTYDGELSAAAYILLTLVLLGIIAGLSWCFYRAITATDRSAQPPAGHSVPEADKQAKTE